MIRLSALYIYPIKSRRGLALGSATVTGGRLNGDREWLLVDGRGRVMHQREPLRTLATYRRLGNEVVFGHYVVALRPHGTLRVGNSLVIRYSCPGQMGDVIRTVE